MRLPATARFRHKCKHHTLCSPSDVLAHPPPTGRVARRSHVAALAPVGASRLTVLSRSCPTHHTGASQQQHTPACHVRHQRRRTNTAAGQRCAAHPSTASTNHSLSLPSSTRSHEASLTRHKNLKKRPSPTAPSRVTSLTPPLCLVCELCVRQSSFGGASHQRHTRSSRRASLVGAASRVRAGP